MTLYHDTDLTSLPFVDIKDKTKLPEASGVYIVVDADLKPLYIGKSVNMRRRWYTHYLASRFCQMEGVKILYMCLNREVIEFAEFQLIAHYKPYWNKRKGKSGFMPKSEVLRLSHDVWRIGEALRHYRQTTNIRQALEPLIRESSATLAKRDAEYASILNSISKGSQT